MNLFDLLKTRNESNHFNEFASFKNEESLTVDNIIQLSSKIHDDLLHQVNSGSRVLLIGTNSRSFVLHIFACWKAGCMVLPFDSREGLERLADAALRFQADLIVDTTMPSSEGGLGRIVAAPFQVKNTGRPKLAYPVAALCIFTSGSTGDPKGVVLSHEALIVGAKNVVEAYGLAKNDVALCVLSMTHINGMVTTLLAPLISGGKVHFFQGAFFEEAIEAIDDALLHGCNWMSAIPMHYSFLASNKRKCAVEAFRFCRSAASALSLRTYEAFTLRYSVPLVESLGMTETAGQIFTNGVEKGKQVAGSVGKPVNFVARIKDENGNHCLTGKVGEVEVKGKSMMTGYLDDPESTQKSFSDGWLKTGDLARTDADGNFIIEGRKKHIAIFGGVNISLGHLEKAIKQVSGIHEVLCLNTTHKLFGEVISVFIQTSGDVSDEKKKEFKSIVKKVLNPLVPSMSAIKGIHFVNDFPKTTVGKIIRKNPLTGLLNLEL